MIISLCAFLTGLIVLFWSAERLVQGAAFTARYYNLPPLLIGILIIGFGTSAPELVVSILAAIEGNPDIALGNAYGSNITNIALIVGLTALISPIAVHSSIIRKELPILLFITLLTVILLWDYQLTRVESLFLLALFSGLIIWNIWQGIKNKEDALALEIQKELACQQLSIQQALTWLMIGLIFLILSSRILLWGIINIANQLGFSEFIIGLTVVAFGTSLPELASALIAVKKNEHDLALGNIIGSNLFNTLAVVGFAGAISPMNIPTEVLSRDILIMSAFTFLLFISCFGLIKPGAISRIEGLVFFCTYLIYMVFLLFKLFG